MEGCDVMAPYSVHVFTDKPEGLVLTFLSELACSPVNFPPQN